MSVLLTGLRGCDALTTKGNFENIYATQNTKCNIKYDNKKTTKKPQFASTLAAFGKYQHQVSKVFDIQIVTGFEVIIENF